MFETIPWIETYLIKTFFEKIIWFYTFSDKMTFEKNLYIKYLSFKLSLKFEGLAGSARKKVGEALAPPNAFWDV